MRTDIILKRFNDIFYDLDIRDGDIVIGESDVQHIEHITLAYPGTYKQAPFIGASIIEKLNSNFGEEEAREIHLHLKSDGYPSMKIDYDGIKLRINEAKG